MPTVVTVVMVVKVPDSRATAAWSFAVTRGIFSSMALNKNTIEHDLKANDVRIALEQFGCFSGWVSAHYLKQNLGPDASPYSKKVDTIPDWLCITRTWEKSKNLALELELSWKGVKRMRYILSKYMEKKTINCLWYIVPSKLFGERLAKVAIEYDVLERKGTSWFMWSLLDDVLDKTKEATIYTLKETMRPQKIFLMPAHSLAHTVSTHQSLT